MRTTEINLENVLSASETIPEDSPIFMVNLLRYKQRADYGDRTDVAPCSGREAYYQHYVSAFNRVVSSEGIEGIKVFYLGAVLSLIVAPSDEHWDDIAIIEYPDFAAFRHVTESSQYAAEADYHRKAALEDWRLIATSQITLPV